MSIDAATLAAASNGEATTKSATSRKNLAEDLDQFLHLLTVQLKHQDPLSPMDSTEFTNQLVQFASVEQQIGVNENLEKMIAMQTATQVSQAVSYIGQTIQGESKLLPLQEGTAEAAYTTPADTKKVTVSVYDADGTMVYMTEGDKAEGTHFFTWDGKNNKGEQLADGTYVLKVQAEDASKETTELDTVITGRVTSVASHEGQVSLFVGGAEIPMDKVISIKAGTQERLSQALTYVGKTVTSTSDVAPLKSGSLAVDYETPKNTSAVKVTVFTENGEKVYETTGDILSGKHTFTWNGLDSQGNPRAEGGYRVKIEAEDRATRVKSQLGTSFDGKVEAATARDGRVYLTIRGADIPAESIVSVREAAI